MLQVTPTLAIPDAELMERFVRSGGPGGQNVNKVATAVRITHKPSGIVVTCSVERSQQQNRRLAIAIIQSKLEALEEAKRDEELPWLLYLQGGPGGKSPRPTRADGWLARALESLALKLAVPRTFV